ncbi:hypothetical protein [Peptoniphilus porci]|uniref:Uncharacterized protein n=1 Tax=Peptoniphilus porci TaxID=2652280 RepID=A0A1U7LX82_9FIRM|nr:hypothetical protein [Peptoniphilus porci]OLR61690.1 hypothetical protein BIV18_10075 [Peptoniphilus porci]
MKKLLIFFVAIMVLLPSQIFAEEVGVKYNDYLRLLEQRYNIKVKTPTINFTGTITTPDGKKINVNPNKGVKADNFSRKDGITDLELAAEVPVNSSITLKDLSVPANGKLTSWDWQLFYSKNEKGFPLDRTEKEVVTSRQDKTYKFDKPGVYYLHLNVADKIKTKKIKGDGVEIYSNQGNWHYKSIRPVGELKIEDWYFLSMKVKVTDNEKPDMMITKLDLVGDQSGNSKSFKTGENIRLIYTPNIVNKKECLDNHSYIISFIKDGKTVKFNQDITSSKLCENKLIPLKFPNPIRSTEEGSGKVCVEVNQRHTKAGDNIANENDKKCIDFDITGGKNDMGVSNISIGGKLKKNQAFRPTMNLNHISGNKKIQNPRFIIEVKDENGRTILQERKSHSGILNPNTSISVSTNGTTSTSTNKVVVCGRVDPYHTRVNENMANSNDSACKEFRIDGNNKNYAINNLKVIPSSLKISKDSGSIRTFATLNMNLVNDSSQNDPLPNNPILRVYVNNRLVKQENVNIAPGSTKPYSITIFETFHANNNFIRVTINEDRRIPEKLLNNADPYRDNATDTNLNVGKLEACQECLTPNRKSYWSERFTTTTYTGTYYEDHYGYPYCLNSNTRSTSTNKGFEEEYYIDKVLFRSKVTKDNNLGNNSWIDIKNATGKVKAGYGFELKIITRYKTNRNIYPKATPSRDWCNYQEVTPQSVAPVNQPTTISLRPNFTMDNNWTMNIDENCMPMVNTETNGQWYNSTMVFEPALRRSVNNKSTTRKIYISPRTQSGDYSFTVATPNFKGLDVGVPKTNNDKHDCIRFTIRVLAQDDIKTHVIQ